MFKKWFISLLALLLCGSIHAQQLAKTDLLADLKFLNKAIQSHPANYDRNHKINIDSLINQTEKSFPDSISWRIYERTVRDAVWEIGCVHTSVKSSPIRAKETVNTDFFPLDVFTDGKTLFLMEATGDSTSKLQAGDEILAINGLPTSMIIAKLMKYKSPDGKSMSYGQQIINRNFAALYFIYFGASSSFRIEFAHEDAILTEDIKGKGKSIVTVKELKVQPEGLQILFTDKAASFGMLPGNVAYLRIESFKDRYKPFYRHIFNYLEKNPSTNLVIDLRDNFGGSRTNVEVLLSYLINHKTSYSIIRPKDNLGKFLKGKEKLKFWSSYLYFDVQEIFTRNKVAGARAFPFKIKPKKYIYDKQIYVLANAYSASSSTVTASYLKHHSHAVVIGQRTSGGEFMNNGGSYPVLVLPRSKIEIKTATYRFSYDFKITGQGGIVPDFPVVYDASTYLKKDLEMEKLMEILQNTGK